MHIMDVHKSLKSHLHVINYIQFNSVWQGLQQQFFLSYNYYTNLNIRNAYHIFCSAKDSISHNCKPLVYASTDTSFIA